MSIEIDFRGGGVTVTVHCPAYEVGRWTVDQADQFYAAIGSMVQVMSGRCEVDDEPDDDDE